jgi:1-acyl-sn-glycerol-3-phosphate acyltransferase
MTYRIFYFFANIAIRVFFRRIYLNGADKIDPSKAYIITSNHPGGFIEPVIMACLFPRDLYFLVRGDLFRKKLLRKILIATHQIPIFRFKDGFSELRNNQESINMVVDALGERKAVMIFAEGSTKYVFHVRPLQKGFARIAFQAFEAYPDLDIEILPIGISFSNVSKMGSDAIINVGDSFSARKYYDEDPNVQNKNIRTLVSMAENGIKKLIVDKKEEESVNDLRREWSEKTKSREEGFFPRVEVSHEVFDDLKNRSFEPENTHVPRVFGSKNSFYRLFYPFALPSMVFMYLPKKATYGFQEAKVKDEEFKSAILVAFGMLNTIVFAIIFSAIICIFFGWKVMLLSMLCLIVSAFFHLFVWENARKK